MAGNSEKLEVEHRNETLINAVNSLQKSTELFVDKPAETNRAPTELKPDSISTERPNIPESPVFPIEKASEPMSDSEKSVLTTN